MFLYFLASGLCTGIALGFLFEEHLFFLGGASAVLTLLFFGGMMREKRVPARGNPRAVFIFAALLFVSSGTLGLSRAGIFSWSSSQETLTSHVGAQALMQGVVVSDPEKKDAALSAVVNVNTLNGEVASGKALAYFPREASVAYGDRVKIRGVLKVPEEFETTGGRVFDYPGYLRVRGVSSVVYEANLLDQTSGGWSVLKSLFALKHSFQFAAGKIFAEPSASLLEGILIGGRQGLPDGLMQAFIVSGLVHVVALSGYNISIVSEALLRSLSFLPSSLKFGASGFAIVLFALMTGGGATALRATIMGLIAILARYLNRPQAALRALSLAVVCMVLWNPSLLLYDRSFILSVLATFGLITLSPFIERMLFKLSPTFFMRHAGFRSLLASTVAVQLFLMPALLYFSGVLSFFALPANLLALPAVPLAMFFGFFAVLLSFIHPMLAAVPALPATLLLEWMIKIAETAAMPGSSVVMPAFPAWAALLAYLPLCGFCMLFFNERAAAPFGAAAK